MGTVVLSSRMGKLLLVLLLLLLRRNRLGRKGLWRLALLQIRRGLTDSRASGRLAAVDALGVDTRSVELARLCACARQTPSVTPTTRPAVP